MIALSPTQRPFLSRVAFICLWLFVFSMPMEKAILIPGFGSISKFAGMLTLGVGLHAIAVQGRVRVPGPIQFGLTLFVFWSALTLRWSISEDGTVERMMTYIQLLILLFVVWEICTQESLVIHLLRAYVVGSFIPAADTLQRFLMGHNTYYNRYATTGFDPNDLALTLALGLPMAYYLSLREKGWMKAVYFLAMGTTIGTIFLTASRGGTMAMTVALTLVPLTMHTLPGKQRVVIIGLGIVGVIGAVLLVPSTTWTRLATAGGEISQGTLNSRTVLWKAGFDAFQHVPLQGIGAGTYPEASARVILRPWGFVPVAHNSFISVIVETGLIGFGIFATVQFLLWRMAKRMPGTTGTMWMVTMGVWTIGVMSLTWEYRKPTWTIFALLAAHAATLHHREEKRVPAASKPGRYFNANKINHTVEALS